MKRYEITFLPGLRDSVQAELESLAVFDQISVETIHAEYLVVSTPLSHHCLSKLRTASAVFISLDFSIPRPKALLGEENFSRLQREILSLSAATQFSSFRVDAAGNTSSVMTRLRRMIAQRCHLPDMPESGEMQIRIKPSSAGWNVLLRTTPSPLSARAWRVNDMPGAVNACIAAAMGQMLSATAGTFCNVCCGSGSILIESDTPGKDFQRIGIDISHQAIAAAKDNLAAAACTATLILGRAEQLPMTTASCEVVVADLPWGERIGKRADNFELYHRFLLEASRILRPSGEILLLTQHMKSFDQSVAKTPGLIEVQRQKIFQKGFWPTIVHMKRS